MSALTQATAQPPATPARLSSYELLASAIASRPLMVMRLEKPEPSYCDGHSLYIDPRLDATQTRQVVLAHAALLAVGSLDARLYKALRGRPRAARRYLALELPRALSVLSEQLPLAVVRQLPLIASRPLSASADASLRLALNAREPIEELAEYLGVLRPFRMSNATQGMTSKGTAGTGTIRDQRAQPQLSEDEELDSSTDRLLKKFMAPIMGNQTMLDLLRQALGAGKSPGIDESDEDDGGGHGAITTQVMQSRARASIDDSSGASNRPDQAEQLFSEPTHWQYPEWNTFTQQYRSDWVKVSEVEPSPPSHSKPPEHCNISPAVIKSQLIKVGVEFELHHRQPVGDDLDLEPMIDYAVELATRHTPSDNIYRASRRTKRDLSALVLLDVSQSTGDRLPNNQSIFGQHREVAREIAKAFSLFGDRIALYGFHSWGRQLTRFVKIKAFHEPMNSRVNQRLNYAEAAGLTRMGAAIRHGTFLLSQEKYNTHRLLLLLSDGFAYDDEYEGRYAEEDTKKSLEEARSKGIACVCVNIGSSKDDAALKRVYGSASYLRTPHATELPGRLRRLMNTAIYQASKRRA